RGRARGEMQKSSAGKFHFEPPSRFTSLDHLVGAQHRRHREAECPGRDQVHNKIELCRLLDRNFARLCPSAESCSRVPAYELVRPGLSTEPPPSAQSLKAPRL